MNFSKLTLLMCFLFMMISGSIAQKQTQNMTEEQIRVKYPRAKIEEARKAGEASLERWKKKREQALAIAQRHNLPVRVEDKNHKVIELQYFQNGRPVYFKTNNLDAAETISTDEVWQFPYFLDGTSITAAIWDGGMVRNSHQELVGRVIQQDTASKPNYHATHVAGTMIATGSSANAQGMAYQANLDAYDWGADLSEIFLSPVWTNVSNHSYSITAGWDYDDSLEVWFWYGDETISETEDFNFGFYTSRSDTVDDYINFYRPYHLIVVAVGNDRTDNGPGPNGGHYVWSPADTAWIWSTTTRDPDGGLSHFDCIPGGLATAKNVLTVGAVYDINGGYSQTGDVVMTDFSSWGPTDDGRIKPDIVANGYELYSCTSLNNSSYGFLSETIPMT
ncbi:MAG: S8 family serine peptidase [Calditrichia bacterium]